MNYLKIIIGLLILLVNITTFMKSDFPTLSSPEQMGIIFGLLLTVSLGLWLMENALNKMLGRKTVIPFKNFSSLFVKPKQYIETCVEPVNSRERPFVIFLMGLFFALNVFSNTITSETKTSAFWILIVLIALFLGYLNYFVLGWIYHILVRLAKGAKNLALSRNIWLLSGLPKYLIVILGVVTGLLVYGHSDYATAFIGSPIHKIFISLFAISILYSTYLGFAAARQLQKTSLYPSLIFLAALPIAFYVILFVRLL